MLSAADRNTDAAVTIGMLIGALLGASWPPDWTATTPTASATTAAAAPASRTSRAGGLRSGRRFGNATTTGSGSGVVATGIGSSTAWTRARPAAKAWSDIAGTSVRRDSSMVSRGSGIGVLLG
jgi:hypothetical protein